MNTSGRRSPDAFPGSTSAAAFVQRFAAMHLFGCSANEGLHHDDTGHSFATMVLPIWTLCLGAYTWWWLRNPFAWNVQQPTQDGPRVNEGPPIEGRMMYALRRLVGRAKRAEQSRTGGNTMKYTQSLSWLISCITHFNGNRQGERQRMREILEETLSALSDDESSPIHGDTEETQKF